MFRKSASLIVAVAALALAPVLTPEASAQSRDERQSQQQQRPRVSPDEARRRGGEAGGGRPIDTQPRRDGNYSVLVESGGRVREVVVDGQTGQARQSGGGDNSNNTNQRRRPN